MAEIKAKVNQISTSASDGLVRNHKVTIDRPEAKGGSDQGPMGGELLLVSLGGCFMSNLLAAIQARESSIKNVTVDITGTLIENPMRFNAIHMVVSADYDDKAELEKLVGISEKGCIVANSIKGSIDLTFSVS